MHVDYNYKYDCIVDPYTYPGTAILRNKFNIRDSSVLSKVERRITEAKLVLLQTYQLPRGHYDLKHLQAVHKYLFAIFTTGRGKSDPLDSSARVSPSFVIAILSFHMRNHSLAGCIEKISKA